MLLPLFVYAGLFALNQSKFCQAGSMTSLSSFRFNTQSPKGSNTSFQISGKNFCGFTTSFQISCCTAQVLHTMTLNSKDWEPSKGAWNTKTLKTSCAPFHFHLKNTLPTLQEGESANMSVQACNPAPSAQHQKGTVSEEWRS